MASSIGVRGGREGSTKSAVADQVSQSVQSTANILLLMRQSSPSHAQLMKLPKNLLAKTTMIKNTELVLKHMPQAISSLDEHVESGLHSVPHLDIVVQLLSNMRKIQLRSLSTLLEDDENTQIRVHESCTRVVIQHNKGGGSGAANQKEAGGES